jgi:hypothetical protein
MKSRRRRIAWVWSVSYLFASCCIALATWAFLSLAYAQEYSIGATALRNPFTELARALEPPAEWDKWDHVDRQAVDEAAATAPVLSRGELLRAIASLGGKALVFVLILAFPCWEANREIWKALRARPLRVAGRRVYAWKLLLLNNAILVAAPLHASLQFYAFHAARLPS